jgi:hypothetical protein
MIRQAASAQSHSSETVADEGGCVMKIEVVVLKDQVDIRLQEAEVEQVVDERSEAGYGVMMNQAEELAH